MGSRTSLLAVSGHVQYDFGKNTFCYFECVFVYIYVYLGVMSRLVSAVNVFFHFF